MDDSYALRSLARQVVNDLRARAQLARSRGDETLAAFLTLQASRLEGPLHREELAARQREAEARTTRLYRI